MRADALLNWDKEDLAETLASRFADADDLIEAFPSIEKAGRMEGDLLDEFIEQNWEIILHEFSIHMLRLWLEQKEKSECGERDYNDYLESWNEYEEYMNEEFCLSVIYAAALFRDLQMEDLGVMIAKDRKS